jgi:hypothetical protein
VAGRGLPAEAPGRRRVEAGKSVPDGLLKDGLLKVTGTMPHGTNRPQQPRSGGRGGKEGSRVHFCVQSRLPAGTETAAPDAMDHTAANLTAPRFDRPPVPMFPEPGANPCPVRVLDLCCGMGGLSVAAGDRQILGDGATILCAGRNAWLGVRYERFETGSGQRRCSRLANIVALPRT